MRAHAQHRLAASRTLWVFVAVLVVVFVGLVVYQKIAVGQLRYASDAALLAELADVTFVDDPDPTLDPKRWPGWRGQRRDGVTTMPDLPRQWPDGGPQELWRQNGGDGYSSFAVADGAAYSVLALGGGKEAVLCWDAATGKERWRHVHEPAATFDYGGPRATPSVDGDRLYTVSSDGVLMCLSVAKGKVVWQKDLRQELGAVAPKWGFSFSPLVTDKLVFATPGGTRGRCLAAFHKQDGSLAWATQDDSPGYSSPVGATLAGVAQVLFFTGRRLLAVTPDEGKLLWQFPWPTRFEVNAATPLVLRGHKGNERLDYVFISSGYGQGSALLKVIPDGRGGCQARAVWQTNELCCHFSSPVCFKDHLYALDETRDLTCLDVRTGKVAWRFEKTGDDDGLRNRGFKKGSLLRIDDVLIVLGEDGKLALVACDHREYRELASVRPFRNRCWTMPALADGRLFLRDRRQVKCLVVRKP